MGMVVTVGALVPWARDFLSIFPSPLVTDTTFFDNGYNISIIAGIDGENHTQILGLSVQTSENKDAYLHLFGHIREIIGPKSVTLISDMGISLKSAAEEVFGNDLNHLYCSFHVWRNFCTKCPTPPPLSLKKSFIHMYKGRIPVGDFLSLVENSIRKVFPFLIVFCS